MNKKYLFGVFLLGVMCFTSCKQHNERMSDYLDYWSSQAAVVRSEIAANHPTDKEGFPSVSSDADKSITLFVRNPQSYVFSMPSAQPSVVVFKDGVTSGGGGTPAECRL